jgi:hypothetical protein
MSKSVFCIAKSQVSAKSIVEQLEAAGIPRSDISALLPDKAGSQDFAHEQHTKLPEGAASGGVVGGVVGGGFGWLVGAGMLAIPGLGPFIAAGPILAALSGVAAGAAVGGISGALIGLGIPEYEAKKYEGKIKEGNILISVHSMDRHDRDRIETVFKHAGAEHISYTEEKAVS